MLGTLRRFYNDYPKTLERFGSRISGSSSDDCWTWTGRLNGGGYGCFDLPRSVLGPPVLAHRLAYLLLTGDEPPVLDHLCRNRACVNPRHLEPVTIQENLLRAVPWNYNHLKTHCPKGHPYSDENTYRFRNGRARACIICAKERARLFYAAKKAAS